MGWPPSWGRWLRSWSRSRLGSRPRSGPAPPPTWSRRGRLYGWGRGSAARPRAFLVEPKGGLFAGTRGAQDGGRLGLALLDRDRERGLAAIVSGGDVGAASEQPRHCLDLAVGGGPHQGGAVVRVAGVDVDPRVEQQLHTLCVEL